MLFLCEEYVVDEMPTGGAANRREEIGLIRSGGAIVDVDDLGTVDA